MCGITGWLGAGPQSPMTVDELAAIQSRLLVHRGPDDHGFEHGVDWGMGFRRLSILDLSEAGHQPMSLQGGRYRLVFNGEIYNHVELRAQLEARGVAFEGTSDSEVLLHLLARRGSDAVTELNGMFAFVFVDTVDRRFIIARDRVGKKPLYLHRSGGHVRFGSELKSLLAWPDAPRELNLDAVAEFFQQGYITGTQCVLQNYERLRPGHCMVGDLDHPEHARSRPYWQIDIAEDRGSSGYPHALLTPDELDELHHLLSDAVRIRLRSDVPVGSFLSGGIDSGLVTTLMADSPAVDPVALTVGFNDRDHDESELAAMVAAASGLRHEIINVSPAGLDGLDRISWYFDEPFADPSALPTMALCDAAAEHATVFLSGDGGDESFGGYRSYIETRRRRWLASVPAPALSAASVLARLMPVTHGLRYQVTKAALPSSGFAAAFDGIPNDPVIRKLMIPRLHPHLDRGTAMLLSQWAATSSRPDLTSRQQILDFERYLPDDILVKMDRASMAASIEVRAPLLDHRLIDWAAQIPRGALIDGDEGKIPLRRLADRLLPAAVRDAPKKGFGVPLDSWFREPSGVDFINDRLLSSGVPHRGLWRNDVVTDLLAEHRAGTGRSYGTYFWRLLVFENWARVYLDQDEVPEPPPAPSATAR